MKKIFILLLLIFATINSFAQFWKEPKNLKQAVEILNEKANDSDKEKIKNTPDEKLDNLYFTSYYCKEITNWVRTEDNTKLCKFLYSKGLNYNFYKIVLVSFKTYLNEGKFDQKSIIEQFRRIEEKRSYVYANRYTLDSIYNVYIPRDINECISEIGEMFSDTVKYSIMEMPESEFTSRYHFGFGRYLRNSWALWMGSRLSKYFNDMGIFHPDDMSGIILSSYYRFLINEDINLESQVEYYKNYWKQVKEEERKAIDSMFATYHIGDTVYYRYYEGYISERQKQKKYDDICEAKGIVLEKRNEDKHILIRLIEACDRKGIIVYNPMRYGRDERRYSNRIVLKKNKTAWFHFETWSMSPLIYIGSTDEE